MDISPAKIIEFVQLVVEKGPAKWRAFTLVASKSIATRTGATALVALVLGSFWILGTHWSAKQAHDELMRSLNERAYANQAALLQYDLDMIDLCATETEKALPLAEFDCKYVPAIYSGASNGLPVNMDRMHEVVANKAYGAMKIDVANYMRRWEMKRLEDSAPTTWSDVVSMLASKWTVISVTIVLCGVCLGLTIVLLKRGGQLGKKKEIELEKRDSAD